MPEHNPAAAAALDRTPLADVVVPVLNESEMLPGFFRRIEALALNLNLIFVDNGSTDGTLEMLRNKPGITLIEHGRNLGYGRSLVDGMRAATLDKVIIIDADCEYPPEAIPALLKKLDTAQVVYTSRFLGGGKVDMAPLRFWGNRMLTTAFNLLYAQKLTDLYTGMKGMRRQTYQGLPFVSSGFEHVMELAACLSRRGCKIAEVPIDYRPRCTGRSKMRHIPELLKAVREMLKWRFASL